MKSITKVVGLKFVGYLHPVYSHMQYTYNDIKDKLSTSVPSNDGEYMLIFIDPDNPGEIYEFDTTVVNHTIYNYGSLFSVRMIRSEFAMNDVKHQLSLIGSEFNTVFNTIKLKINDKYISNFHFESIENCNSVLNGENWGLVNTDQKLIDENGIIDKFDVSVIREITYFEKSDFNVFEMKNICNYNLCNRYKIEECKTTDTSVSVNGHRELIHDSDSKVLTMKTSKVSAIFNNTNYNYKNGKRVYSDIKVSICDDNNAISADKAFGIDYDKNEDNVIIIPILIDVVFTNRQSFQFKSFITSKKNIRDGKLIISKILTLLSIFDSNNEIYKDIIDFIISNVKENPFMEISVYASKPYISNITWKGICK